MAEGFDTVPEWLARHQDYKPKDLLGDVKNEIVVDSNEESKQTENADSTS